MYGTNPFAGISEVGLLAILVIWLLATILTGYLLGIGIWAAAPNEFKRLAKLELEARLARGDAPPVTGPSGELLG
jgi:hypothetical protein